MRELYGDRWAICCRPRVMRSLGNEMSEALTGGRVGRAIEPRNIGMTWSPTQSVYAEGNTSRSRTSGHEGPTGSENLCTHVDFFSGNREILRLTRAVASWSATGTHLGHAVDVRSEEVGRPHSIREVLEQRRYKYYE